MKIWDKGDATLSKLIEDYTIGQDRDLDLLLAPFDVYGSMAHAAMLESIGLLTAHERAKLHVALKEILRVMSKGLFRIEEGVEDVHSQVESFLIAALGDVGKKLHSGRSRNDQVLLDIRLFVREEIKQVAGRVEVLFDTLNALSLRHKEVLLPGYTHLQVAMPSSFGLWFGAYAESLTDDLQMLLAAYKIVNQNPLGSGAGYGSSFPLDRKMTTRLLGLSEPVYNSVYAQMSRGKVERVVAFALSSLAATLSRMSMDVCLYNSQNFGFFRLPEEMTTGSSIMPHKQNPDVFELIRAKMNQLQALPNEIALITTNLPSGYHRDMQTIKETFLPAFGELKSTLDICTFAMKNIEVREGILDEAKYNDLFTVEEVNRLVNEGVPFREAYIQVGQAVKAGDVHFRQAIHHTHLGSIGDPANAEIEQKMKRIVKAFDFEQAEKALTQLVGE